MPIETTFGGGLPLQERGGNGTGPGEANEPVFDEGEYRGRSWSNVVEQDPEYFFELRARFNLGNSARLYVEWVERHYQVLRTMVRRIEPRVTPHTIIRT